MAREHERVVCFASGGQPLLCHLVAGAKSPSDVAAAKRKFHLFAGLNWGSTPKTQQDAYTTWIAHRLSRSILVLDTGTHGTTFREAARLAKETIERSPLPDAGGRIQVVGLVDGHTADQVPFDGMVRTAGGAEVHFIVRYLRVPRVFSEDCVALLGYNPARRQLSERPFRQPGIIRIVGKPSAIIESSFNGLARYVPARAVWLRRKLLELLCRLTPTHVVASTDSGKAFASLLSQPERHVPRVRWYSRDVQWAAAQSIIAQLKDADLLEAAQMLQWGLITFEESLALADVIERLYSEVAARYPTLFWDWKEKKLVRGRATTTFWADGEAAQE